MQQTEKYKLNLIESSDPFLPDALNANTQRVEDVLQEKMEGPVVDLEQRVTVLEGHKAIIGTYVGNKQSSQFINLGFTPIAVIAASPNKDFSALGVLGGPKMPIKIMEGGFEVYAYGSFFLNENGYTFGYLAFV